MEALVKSELLTLFAHAKKHDPRVWLLMLIQYWHAGRNSEMIGLRRDNFKDGFIRYERGKGSEPCVQQLVAHANPLLDERTAVFEFVRKSKGNQRLYPRTRWTYWRHVKALAIDAGIPAHKAKTTVLKHSICTHLLEKLPPNAVQRRAGHVNGANTLRYAKLREDQVDPLVVDAVGI